MVGIGFLAFFVSGAGQSHTFSVFLGPVSTELGISQTEWGVAFGLATLIAAFALPYVGRLTDRHGPKRMLLAVAVALGLACFGFAGAGGLLSLGLTFGALRFFGQGSLMLNGSNLVSRWFERRRGFALSIMALGFSASMGIHPPLAQWLMDQIGWRQAWMVLGVSSWFLLIPCVYLLVRERPQDIGLQADGDAHEPTDGQGHAKPLEGFTRAQALRTSTFYIIGAGLLTLSMLVTCLHLFQVSIFESHGVSRQVAAYVFPVSAMTMVVTVPCVGLILDRVQTRWVFACAQVLMVSSLLCVTQVSGVASAVAYAIVFGLNNAVSITLFTFLWPRFFGLRHLGSIQGIGQMIGVVGASLGALPLGIAFDIFGGYDGMLVALAVQPALCAGLALFLKPPKMPKGEAAASTSP